MNINSIRREMIGFAKSLDDGHKNILLPIAEELPIRISNRMTKTLGQVSLSRRDNAPLYVTFNKKYIEYGDIDDVVDTICHEMVHILANIVAERNVGHGDLWKSLCRKYGVEPTSTKKTSYRQSYNEANPTKKVSTTKVLKYNIICCDCGKIVAKRQRLNENLLKGYKSGCCGSKLKAVEIATGKVITF